jgi:hypothetical protein
MAYDHRYTYVTCSKCLNKWQRIDYGCAHHQLTCGYPLPAQLEPNPTRALTTEEWEQFDKCLPYVKALHNIVEATSAYHKYDTAGRPWLVEALRIVGRAGKE